MMWESCLTRPLGPSFSWKLSLLCCQSYINYPVMSDMCIRLRDRSVDSPFNGSSIQWKKKKKKTLFQWHTVLVTQPSGWQLCTSLQLLSHVALQSADCGLFKLSFSLTTLEDEICVWVWRTHFKWRRRNRKSSTSVRSPSPRLTTACPLALRTDWVLGFGWHGWVGSVLV